MAGSRPGNPERGWNDPPMSMYNADSQMQSPSSRKNPLIQRVGMLQCRNVSITPTAASVSLGSLIPQPSSPGAPPVNKAPPGQAASCPPTAHRAAGSNEVKVEKIDPFKELPEDICDTSVAKLRGVLEECVVKLKARVADDIKKRIDMLHSAWQTEKLSIVVQHRMAKLATALSEREYDEAHAVHLSLMVDYVSEVSQWMVGIKRLIMEARTILPHPPITEPKGEDATKQITNKEKDSLIEDTVEQSLSPLATRTDDSEHVSDNKETADDDEQTEKITGSKEEDYPKDEIKEQILSILIATKDEDCIQTLSTANNDVEQVATEDDKPSW